MRSLDAGALEALARAYDREEATQMGEPSPWDSADGEGDESWKADRIGCARAAAEAFLDALPQEPAGWRGMDSAPKDGTDILLGSWSQTYQDKPVAPRVTIGRWTTEEECREQIGDCGGECRCPEYIYHDPSWMSWDGGFTEENPPNGWMPLPTPPSEDR